jgi:hypothetical protein
VVRSWPSVPSVGVSIWAELKILVPAYHAEALPPSKGQHHSWGGKAIPLVLSGRMEAPAHAREDK